MAEFKQIFYTEAAITTSGLSALANGSTHISSAVDNSTTLYDEIILEVKIGGTAAGAAYAEVRIAASIDGGTDWSTWTSPAVVLPSIDMSVDNPIYHARFTPPQHWKLMVCNRTGAAFDVGSASFQGVNYTGA